jgi:hypothetical protein
LTVRSAQSWQTPAASATGSNVATIHGRTTCNLSSMRARFLHVGETSKSEAVQGDPSVSIEG